MIADAEEGLGRNPPCWPKNWPNNPDYEKSDRIFNILMIDKNYLAVIPDYNKQIYSEQYKMLRLDQSIFSTNEDFKNNTLKLISKEKKLNSVGPEKTAKLMEYLAGPEFESIVNIILDDHHAARKLIDDKERSDQLFYEKMRTNIDNKVKNFNKLIPKLKAPKERE